MGNSGLQINGRILPVAISVLFACHEHQIGHMALVFDIGGGGQHLTGQMLAWFGADAHRGAVGPVVCALFYQPVQPLGRFPLGGFFAPRVRVRYMGIHITQNNFGRGGFCDGKALREIRAVGRLVAGGFRAFVRLRVVRQRPIGEGAAVIRFGRSLRRGPELLGAVPESPQPFRPARSLQS